MSEITQCPLCQSELIDPEKIKTVNTYNENYTKIQQENSDLKTQVEELNQQIQQLQEKLKKYENPDKLEFEYNDFADNAELQELLRLLKHQLVIEAIKNIIHDQEKNQDDLTLDQVGENTHNENLQEIITQDHLETNSPEDNYTQSEIQLTQQECELVKNYQDSNWDLQTDLIKVSEPQESQTSRWGGSKEAISFKNNRQGNYWIVNIEDCLYMVPRKQMKINEYSQDTLMSAFDCRNYQRGKSQGFVLIKPAKVTDTSTNEWKLIERGILQF